MKYAIVIDGEVREFGLTEEHAKYRKHIKLSVVPYREVAPPYTIVEAQQTTEVSPKLIDGEYIQQWEVYDLSLDSSCMKAEELLSLDVEHLTVGAYTEERLQADTRAMQYWPQRLGTAKVGPEAITKKAYSLACEVYYGRTIEDVFKDTGTLPSVGLASLVSAWVSHIWVQDIAEFVGTKTAELRQSVHISEILGVDLVLPERITDHVSRVQSEVPGDLSIQVCDLG